MRRAYPQRIYEAQRTGMLRRLADQEHLGDDHAESLIAAWEAEAAARGYDRSDPRYWDDVATWIKREIPKRNEGRED
jgi:hypothetical protein